MTGTAAATTNNGKGIAGIAQVTFKHAKVLNEWGWGVWSDVASGIRWCSDEGADVISMSLGGSSPSTAVEEAIDYAWDAGSLLVAAAGNAGCCDTIGYPAKYAKTIAVACTTSSKSRCDFSSTGPEVDLAAPGKDIESTCYESDAAYCKLSGTSMSTPHVAGVATLVKSLYPGNSNEQIRAVLEYTAEDRGSSGLDEEFGHGIVRADRSFLPLALSINNDATNTNQREVTLRFVCSSTLLVQDVRYANEDLVWNEWETFSRSRTWSLTEGDGIKTVHYQCRTADGAITETSDTVFLDTVMPEATVTINGGAAATNSPTLTLTLTCSDPAPASGVWSVQYLDDTGKTSPWESFKSQRIWTLGPFADGTRAVWYKCRDAAGNIRTKGAVILLDTTRPVNTISINEGEPFTNTTSVDLSLTCSDPNPGSGVQDVRYRNSGENWTSWEDFSTSTPWLLPEEEGTRQVDYQCRDAVLNVAEVSDTIVLDMTPPVASITINGGEANTFFRDVRLTLACEDELSGVQDVRYANEDHAWTAWESFSGIRDWTLSENWGIKRVYYECRDGAGNIVEVSDTIGYGLAE